MMKNAYLQEISILLQFGGEILALLCPDDSIQISLFLSRFQTLRTETKLTGGGGGGGATPIYGLDRYVSPNRLWFLRVAILK